MTDPGDDPASAQAYLIRSARRFLNAPGIGTVDMDDKNDLKQALAAVERYPCPSSCRECGSFGGHCETCPEYVAVPRAPEPGPVPGEIPLGGEGV